MSMRLCRKAGKLAAVGTCRQSIFCPSGYDAFMSHIHDDMPSQVANHLLRRLNRFPSLTGSRPSPLPAMRRSAPPFLPEIPCLSTCSAMPPRSATTPLAPFSFDRRDPRPDDVTLEVLYCGVCHSDLHNARNDWGFSSYPVVPGHEIIGRVTAVGSAVTKFKVGDAVGVGCMVDSCFSCDPCTDGEEQYCPHCVYTYGPCRSEGRAASPMAAIPKRWW